MVVLITHFKMNGALLANSSQSLYVVKAQSHFLMAGISSTPRGVCVDSLLEWERSPGLLLEAEPKRFAHCH